MNDTAEKPTQSKAATREEVEAIANQIAAETDNKSTKDLIPQSKAPSTPYTIPT